jgi:hypothetical protein
MWPFISLLQCQVGLVFNLNITYGEPPPDHFPIMLYQAHSRFRPYSNFLILETFDKTNNIMYQLLMGTTIHMPSKSWICHINSLM